jgi:hypothetical protein
MQVQVGDLLRRTLKGHAETRGRLLLGQHGQHAVAELEGQVLHRQRVERDRNLDVQQLRVGGHALDCLAALGRQALEEPGGPLRPAVALRFVPEAPPGVRVGLRLAPQARGQRGAARAGLDLHAPAGLGHQPSPS